MRITHRPYVVAELGTNLYPYTDRKIERMLHAALAAYVDAVKVQLWRTDHFPVKERKAKRPLEFPRAKFQRLCRQARDLGLDVGASVFDTPAVDLCIDSAVDFVKLATREQTNEFLRNYVHRHYRGTVMRSVEYPLVRPVIRWPREVTLACIPTYPTRRFHWHWMHDLDLVMPEPWGWSSHTWCMEDCLMAVVKGAMVVEKHMYIAEGKDPEYRWSYSPENLGTMTRFLKVLAVDRAVMLKKHGRYP